MALHFILALILGTAHASPTAGAFGGLRYTEWSTPGTYTFTPPRLGVYTFACVGGGGGGKSGLGGGTAGSGGSGGEIVIRTVIISTAQAVIVGSAGTGGTGAANTDGLNGTASAVGSFLLAKGGNGAKGITNRYTASPSSTSFGGAENQDGWSILTSTSVMSASQDIFFQFGTPGQQGSAAAGHGAGGGGGPGLRWGTHSGAGGNGGDAGSCPTMAGQNGTSGSGGGGGCGDTGAAYSDGGSGGAGYCVVWW